MNNRNDAYRLRAVAIFESSVVKQLLYWMMKQVRKDLSVQESRGDVVIKTENFEASSI